METPASTGRVTRSQTLSASNDALVTVSRKVADSENNSSKSKSTVKQQDQSALVDMTNDSPIVGVANGVTFYTPLAKKRGSRMKNTPGSGEALLRGQVKTLLLKVEEEVELSKFSLESTKLDAPMPSNTPQIQNLSVITPSIVLQRPLVPQVVSRVFDGKNVENCESDKSVISRSLLFDFSEKSQLSNASKECYSELIYEEVVQAGMGIRSCCIEDDDASIWSMQDNESIHDEDDEEIGEDEEDYSKYVGEVEEEYDEGGLLH